MKITNNFIWWLFSLLIVFYSCTNQQNELKTMKGDLPNKEIVALINQMTIEEKAGQMTQLNIDVVCVGEVYKLEEPHRLDTAKLRAALVDWHVGSILNCGGHAYPRAQWHQLIGGIQKVATTETRLRIPILYGIDAIHGANYVLGSTLFPQQLAQAASFNPELTREASRVTAYETRAAGIPWNFSPVLDAGRNPNWSRFFETYGEDVLVCRRFGEAAVDGYQGEGIIDDVHVAACMKHFLGYSGARTGKDRTPAYIPEMQLREIYLPVFEDAIAAGALTVMINSGEINGIPVHASKEILTNLLRDELQFTGVAVTDWEDVIKLHKNHKVASSLKEAVFQSVDAGIDMCMVPNDYDFTRLLIELVKEGRIKESRLDESVYRILDLKKKLNLFERYEVPSIEAFSNFGSTASQQLSKKIAGESITLLENRNSFLPLNAQQRVLVTGPAAHSMTLLNGAWTRTWQGVDTTYDDSSKNTIYEALQINAPGKVNYVKGCGLTDILNLEVALRAAATSDVIIACLGEEPSTEKPGDIDDLEMPAAQQQFVKALIATGKPVVLVLVENRPRIIREIEQGCAAVVMAYQPGDYGADALSDILYGKINPSGRLPFTYPRYNQSLLWYDHKYTETVDTKFGNTAFQPQWEFGHGLSYSTILYSAVTLSADTLKGNDSLIIQVTVKNTGKFDALETVLLFVTDQYASVTPAVRKLKDFKKVSVPVQSSQLVTFSISKEDLQFVDRQMQWIVEEGSFDLTIGGKTASFYYKP